MRIYETLESEGLNGPSAINPHASTAQVRADNPVKLSVTDRESWYLDNYLRALDIPIAERIKLCNETVENFHRHKAMCERSLSPAWVINEACKQLADHSIVAEGEAGSQESMLATVESRLQIWLSADSMPAQQESTRELVPATLENVVSTPPIRRAHMPVVVLELNPSRRLATRFKSMVLWVCSVTVQAYRRLLLEM